jgi:hypothetical protein
MPVIKLLGTSGGTKKQSARCFSFFVAPIFVLLEIKLLFLNSDNRRTIIPLLYCFFQNARGSYSNGNGNNFILRVW